MKTSEVKVKVTPFTLVAKKPHKKKQSKSNYYFYIEANQI